MVSKEFKEKYNSLIEREKKAEKFLNGATEEQYKKWCPAFLELIQELSKMLAEYKRLTGEEMTTEQVLNGFGGI